MAVDETDMVDAGPEDGQLAFEAAVEAHWTAVYRLLYRVTGSTHDAEELTQETFLRALRSWQSYRPGTLLRAWLLRIATNAWLDVRRKRQRAKSVPLNEDVPGDDAAPGDRLETADERRLVEAALEELSETARAVFHLRVQESLSFREIAEILGSTEHAVRWHMHDARRKLLARLKP